MRRHLVFMLVSIVLVFGCVQAPAIDSTPSNRSAPANATNLSQQSPTDNLTAAADMTNEQGLPVVDYYFSPKCSACNEVAPLIARLQENLSGQVQFRFHDLTTQKGWDDFNMFAKRFSVPDNKRYIPVLVIGNQTFTGLDGIKPWLVYPALLDFINQTGNLSGA